MRNELRNATFLGIGIGVLLILLNTIGLFSMLVPPVASALATNVGKFLVIVLLAPIIEETVIRGVGLTALQKRFKMVPSALINGAIFAVYHTAVYSGILLENFELAPLFVVSGAFIAAFMFGTAMSFVVRRKPYNNNSLPGFIALWPAIIAHAIINFWLVRGTLVVIG